MKTACIIGGGLGGLMTGALLTKEGYRVTVLEQHAALGGGLQNFSRKGHLFDPCMHIFGGLQPGGNLRMLLEYLGVMDRLHIEPYFDTLVDGEEKITLPSGREAWVKAVGQGEHIDELNAYVDALYRYAGTEDLFNMRPDTGERHEEPNISAKELIAKYISDPKLQRRLAGIVHLYAGTSDSPALIHALISVLHIEGVYSLSPSVKSLADALCDIITAGGGSFLTHTRVTTLEAKDGQVSAVVCGDKRFEADCYISAISIGALLQLAPPEAFSPAFRKRISQAPQSSSAFCVYAILKPHSLPFNHENYHISRPGTDPWIMSDCTPDQWPQNMFLMPYAAAADPRYAEKITIVAPMDYGFVRQWEDTTTGHRPDDYLSWKEQMAQQALQLAREAIGPMEIEALYTASPLTIRDYNNTTLGSCYGLHASVENPLLTTLSPRTRLPNLFLTGQDVNFHGMVGTSLTAILTAEAIVGHNAIVNKIISES